MIGANPVTFECASCHEHKVKGLFPKRARLPDGIEKTCLQCRNQMRRGNPSRASTARHLEYLESNDDRYSRNQRKRLENLGVSQEWYAEKFREQGGRCAICKQPERRINTNTKKPFLLAVDHNHNTGKVRGLLCTSCNKGLGLLGDTEESIKSALDYLRSTV